MFLPLRVFFRNMHSTSALLSHNNHLKEAAKFKKMLDKLSKRRTEGSTGLLSKSSVDSPYENDQCTPRMITLNKIYMESLIPMITGGRYSSQLVDLGVEISKVQVTKCLKYLNIFWAGRNPDVPQAAIEEVLHEALRELQKEVGNIMRHTVRTPFLRFVKDVRLEREIHLERIFEVADYGDDYEPVYKRKVFTPTEIPRTSELKMPEDTLGLDHNKIKQKIDANILRFKAININMNQNAEQSEKKEKPKYAVPEKLIPFNKHDYHKFYIKRRNIALKRLRKGYYDD